eukprot:Rmarinus@m.16442
MLVMVMLTLALLLRKPLSSYEKKWFELRNSWVINRRRLPSGAQPQCNNNSRNRNRNQTQKMTLQRVVCKTQRNDWSVEYSCSSVSSSATRTCWSRMRKIRLLQRLRPGCVSAFKS